MPHDETGGVEQILREMYGTGISVWGQQRAQILKMNAAERTADGHWIGAADPRSPGVSLQE